MLMTPWDKSLIKQAYKVKIWDYQDVYDLIPFANSKKCRKKLKNIAALLYDYHCNER